MGNSSISTTTTLCLCGFHPLTIPLRDHPYIHASILRDFSKPPDGINRRHGRRNRRRSFLWPRRSSRFPPLAQSECRECSRQSILQRRLRTENDEKRSILDPRLERSNVIEGENPEKSQSVDAGEPSRSRRESVPCK